jgi:hypothetical protein
LLVGVNKLHETEIMTSTRTNRAAFFIFIFCHFQSTRSDKWLIVADYHLIDAGNMEMDMRRVISILPDKPFLRFMRDN